MNAYSVKTDKLEREFSTSALYGLKRTQVDANRRRFGKNELEKAPDEEKRVKAMEKTRKWTERKNLLEAEMESRKKN